MSLSLSPQMRIVALVGVVAVLGLGGFVFTWTAGLVFAGCLACAVFVELT